MSEHLRAFVVITGLMALAFFISKRLFSHALEPKFVERLYGTGYAATAVMFLSYNMWIFLAGLAGLSFLVTRRFSHPLALFVFLLLLMPGYTVRIPGFGVINYLIELNPWRLLSFTVLLPAAVWLSTQKHLPTPGCLLPDKLLIAFVLYTSWLAYVHHATFTGGLRHLAAMTMDSLLIYYVSSRGLMIKGAVRHVMVAFTIACIFLALVGAFEFFKHWLLYSNVRRALNALPGLFGYLGRGETLRASATTGQPIVLGFVMMVALLIASYVQRLVVSRAHQLLLSGVMGLGLVAAMSRGPWVGAAVGLAVVALFSTNPVSKLLKLAAATLGISVLIILLPGGDKVIDYLPWIGTVDVSNITYRELLWEQTLLVVDQHFWIGSIGYTELPEFDVIRQGGGFVDIVNSYVGVMLSYGFIGFCMYVALIFSAVFKIARHAQKNKFKNTENSAYASALIGVLASAVVTITTVSSISHIAPLMVFLIGAGVAVSEHIPKIVTNSNYAIEPIRLQ